MDACNLHLENLLEILSQEMHNQQLVIEPRGLDMSNCTNTLSLSFDICSGSQWKSFIGQAKVFTHGANTSSQVSEEGVGGDHSSRGLQSISITVAG